ncbi:hypothetical protein [uncultured Microscilla sp.]|uniref:hypothetical protein n=1 Tax=uncultured Microscilla sp. TaxID=432653 RepID=UPI002631A827|nr:hypothetical protein [uncultured Microscilla sp.]
MTILTNPDKIKGLVDDPVQPLSQTNAFYPSPQLFFKKHLQATLMLAHLLSGCVPLVSNALTDHDAFIERKN